MTDVPTPTPNVAAPTTNSIRKPTTGARIRLALAAIAFLGWLTWLAIAVSQKDRPDRVSRAQLTAADTLVVATLTVDSEGVPQPKVQIRQKWNAAGPAEGADIEVTNLTVASPVGKPFPGPGDYLLPLIRDGKQYRIAGLPRSPGYEGNPYPAKPIIYSWTNDVEAQLRTLGYAK